MISNTYLCQCLSSYGGTNCQLTINVCTPNPCLNNGICITSLDMEPYRCECQYGYIGTRCEYGKKKKHNKKKFFFEYLVSGCISSPCRNGGRCVSSTRNCSSTTCPASCICMNGTTGIYCEEENLSCLRFPCLNGGTCLINPMTNMSHCQCPSNTIGNR
jgi:hypothetical protein